MAHVEPALHASPLPEICPVCHAPDPQFFQCVDSKEYFHCTACEVRFLPAQYWLPDSAEYAHYLTHENQCDDPGYRRFLSKLATPLLKRLPPASKGLDFGCGPGPALAKMLRDGGHDMAVYDPYFAPDPAPLSSIYDFVTCTETVEHFHNPHSEFTRLRALVRPGGWLGLMTCFQTDDARFAAWRYRMDPTHVVFYREATFRFLAQRWNWKCHVPEKDVVLMQRPVSL